ncbi:Tyrosine recombinase XerC [subsurface metagenome]
MRNTNLLKDQPNTLYPVLTVKPVEDEIKPALNRISVEDVVKDFILSQDVRPNSRKTYARAIKAFFIWVHLAAIDLNTITGKDVIRYREDLLSKGKAVNTVNTYITVVRCFFEYTENRKIYPNVARGIKSPKRKDTFTKESLTPEMVKEFLSQYNDPRDFAIVNLLVRAGLRTIEASRLNIESIQVKRGKFVLMIHGKGRDDFDNYVVLTKSAHDPLKAYLKTRGKLSPKEPMFLSRSNNNSSGQRLTPRSISEIAKRGLTACGFINGFSAHSLRHTCAVSILRAGGDLFAAQRVLRHSDPKTTQIYLKSIDEENRIDNNPAEELIDTLF